LDNFSGSKYCLAITTVSFIMIVFNQLIPSIISFHLMTQLLLTYTQLGLLFSVFSFAYSAMQIPSGIMSDRFGGEKVLPIALALMGFGTFLFAFSSNFYNALLFRLISGFGAGMILPTSINMISNRFTGKKLDLAMGVFSSGWSIGQVLMYLVVPLMLIAMNWRNILQFVAIMTLATMFFASLYKVGPSKKVNNYKNSKTTYFNLLSKELVLFTIFHLTYLGTIIGMLSWTPSFLKDQYGVKDILIGMIIAGMGIMSSIASISGGYLSKMHSKKIIIYLSSFTTIFSLILITFAKEFQLVIPVLFLFAFGSQLYTPALFALVPTLSKRGYANSGLTFGIFNTGGNVGGLIAPVLMGCLIDMTKSYSFAFLIPLGMSLIGLLSAFIVRKRLE